MSEVERILDLFQRTFEGEAWHGDPVMTILSGITAEQAAARPIANGHSIWELVLHMAVWKDVCRWRIEHSERVPTDAENFPAVTDASEHAWQQAVARLKQAHRELCQAVAGMTDRQLAEEVPAGGGLPHSIRLHGVIQHDCYHSGQIALLKKTWR